MPDAADALRAPLLWRIATPVAWLAALLTTCYYAAHRPHEGPKPRRTIWAQNAAHATPFALHAPLTSVYWIALWLLQLWYAALLATGRAAAAGIALAPTFAGHNLLVLGFVHLYTRSELWWALLLAALDFVLLTWAYFRFSKLAVRATAAAASLSDRAVHVGALAGPLAFALVALYWDGAAAVHARHQLAARIVANVFVWSWAAYGGFYLVAFGDWALAFCLSVLCASLGVAQFMNVTFTLQWIFAFVIMAVLFLGSLAVGVPRLTGAKFGSYSAVEEDREHAPLLAGEGQA